MGLFGPADIFEMILSREIQEQAVDDAIAHAYSSCGNSGQESIVEMGESAFRSWAASVISGYGSQDIGSAMLSALGQDKYDGTDQIWDEAATIVEDSVEFF